MCIRWSHTSPPLKQKQRSTHEPVRHPSERVQRGAQQLKKKKKKTLTKRRWRAREAALLYVAPNLSRSNYYARNSRGGSTPLLVCATGTGYVRNFIISRVTSSSINGSTVSSTVFFFFFFFTFQKNNHPSDRVWQSEVRSDRFKICFVWFEETIEEKKKRKKKKKTTIYVRAIKRKKMPRAFLITHRRYNGVEEEFDGSGRGTTLTLAFVIVTLNIFRLSH